jgi:hypothetical protein
MLVCEESVKVCFAEGGTSMISSKLINPYALAFSKCPHSSNTQSIMIAGHLVLVSICELSLLLPIVYQ